MAKYRSFLSISGEMDKKVYVDSNTYGKHMRNPPAPGSHKDEKAIKDQYSRTGFLNNLASALNKAFGSHTGFFKQSDLYQQMQCRFRKEPENSRGLLLLQLKTLELHFRYPLSRFGTFTTAVKKMKKNYRVDLQVKSHPPKSKSNADCYYYELFLFTFPNKTNTLTWESQVSDWIPINIDRPGFEFSFPAQANDQHWILVALLRLGIAEVEISTREAKGMQVIDVGGFNKQEQAILKQRHLEASTEKAPAPIPEQRIRVKAKRIK